MKRFIVLFLLLFLLVSCVHSVGVRPTFKHSVSLSDSFEVSENNVPGVYKDFVSAYLLSGLFVVVESGIHNCSHPYEYTVFKSYYCGVEDVNFAGRNYRFVVDRWLPSSSRTWGGLL
jgi:hypothetical protein